MLVRTKGKDCRRVVGSNGAGSICSSTLSSLPSLILLSLALSTESASFSVFDRARCNMLLTLREHSSSSSSSSLIVSGRLGNEIVRFMCRLRFFALLLDDCNECAEVERLMLGRRLIRLALDLSIIVFWL